MPCPSPWVSVNEKETWSETNLTYQTDSASRGTTAMAVTIGCLAVAAVVVAVDPGGWEEVGWDASCFVAVEREAGLRCCTFPCCEDFGVTP